MVKLHFCIWKGIIPKCASGFFLGGGGGESVDCGEFGGWWVFTGANSGGRV